MAKISIRTPFFCGTVDAVVGAFPAGDLIVGNFPGVRDISEKELIKWQDDIVVAAVETRSQARKSDSRLFVPTVPISMTPSELAEAQKADSSLSYCFKDAQEGKSATFKSGSARYFVDGNTSILYRIYSREGIDTKQVVVPRSLVPTVLKLSHDTPMACHMGIARTKQKVLSSFHWPTIAKDVRDYCRSCIKCQQTRGKGRKLEASREHSRARKNRSRSLRSLSPGDKVLLLPTSSNRLLTTWQGPFVIDKKVSDVNYVVNVKGQRKMFHINMLQRFVERPSHLVARTSSFTNTAFVAWNGDG